MNKEVNVFALEGEQRPAAWAAPIALKGRKGARTCGVIIRHQDKQRAVDGVVGLVKSRTVQHGRSILKLELTGQIAVGAHPDLVGVAIIKTPIGTQNKLFANLFPNPDEGALDRAIAVAPEVHFGGIESRVNAIGPTGEQRGFTHHHPLRKAAGFLERPWLSLQQQRGELAAWIVKAHDREGGVNLACLFDPGHITRLKGKV